MIKKHILLLLFVSLWGPVILCAQEKGKDKNLQISLTPQQRAVSTG